jgi:MFS family permease
MVNQEVNKPIKTEPWFFYGYIVVIVSFFIMAVSWGTFMTFFGVFLKPMITEFGWTRAITSGAYSLSNVLSGVLSIVMGGLTDRFGPRIVLTFCGFSLGLGYLLMSQVSAIWQLYLLFGVIIGIGISGAWVPLLSTVARWFVKRRSLMTGIVVAGMSIGQLITPMVVSRLIVAYGWRLSSLRLGGVVLIVMVLAAQFLRRDPVQMGQLPYSENTGKQQILKSDNSGFSFREAVNTTQFRLFFIMLFCLGFCLSSILVHIVPHATDLKISAISAANILAAVGGTSIIGNYMLGGLGDRIGNRQIIIVGFILMAAALFWLVQARELWMFYLFAVVFGLAFGGIAASESPTIAWLFGLSSHGSIFGFAMLGLSVGAAAGPFVTGYIFDTTGSYQLAFLVCAFFGIIGLISSAILRPTKRLSGRI